MKNILVKIQTTIQSNRLVVSLLQALWLSGLVALILWLWQPHSQKPDVIDLPEVITLSMPPPPPPRVEASIQPAENPQIQLTVNSKSERKTAIKFDINKRSVQPKHELSSALPNINQLLSLELPTLSLEQLDQLPHLLTPVKVTFPRRLIKNGVHQVLIKLDVMINQQGQVSLIQIVENPYPELVEEIRTLVRNSRFSAPLKNQSPVNARFIWPVNIRA